MLKLFRGHAWTLHIALLICGFHQPVWAADLPAAQELPELVIYTSAARGMIDVDAQGRIVGGLGKGVLERLAASAGRRPVLINSSMARSLIEVERRSDSCFSGAPRTAELEPRYQWVGPLVRTSISLFARADDGRDFDQVDAFKTMRLGAVKNSAASQWVSRQGLKVTEYALPDIGARMLTAQRIDLLVASEVTFAGLPDAAASLRLVRKLAHVYYHLACHPGMPEDLRQRIDGGLQTLRRQGDLHVFGLP